MGHDITVTPHYTTADSATQQPKICLSFLLYILFPYSSPPDSLANSAPHDVYARLWAATYCPNPCMPAACVAVWDNGCLPAHHCLTDTVSVRRVVAKAAEIYGIHYFASNLLTAH